MTGSPARPRQSPVAYKLRVTGRLDGRWSPWFDGLTLTSESNGTTSISGVVADQAQLHGLLTKIRDLGIALISVEAIYPPGNPDRDPAIQPRVGPE